MLPLVIRYESTELSALGEVMANNKFDSSDLLRENDLNAKIT